MPQFESSMIDHVGACFDRISEEVPGTQLLQPHGELQICNVGLAQVVRLELEERQYFHLHAVVIRNTDGHQVNQEASVSASSGHRGRWPDQLLLADPNGRHDKAFHTLKDQAPWLQFEFDRPTNIDDIQIVNSKDQPARISSLRVKVIAATGESRVIFSAREERDEVRARLRKYGMTDLLFAEGSGNVGEDLLVALALRDDVTAERLLGQFGIDPNEAQRYKELFNVALLSAREREWTMHGIRRSFRFWSTEEKRHYIRESLDLVECLSHLSPDVCFGFGSALAAVRDGDLIPHDDDIDLIVGFENKKAPTLSAAMNLLENHLASYGYSTAGKHLAHRWVSRPGELKSDVFAGIYENDRISWYPGERRAFRRSDIFPSKDSKLVGIPCPVPQRAEVYLRELYGETWRRPDPSFKHTWGRSRYSDLA